MANQTKWAVYILRKKAQRIGIVEGKDHKDALVRAMIELKIKPSEKFRVSVQPE